MRALWRVAVRCTLFTSSGGLGQDLTEELSEEYFSCSLFCSFVSSGYINNMHVLFFLIP